MSRLPLALFEIGVACDADEFAFGGGDDRGFEIAVVQRLGELVGGGVGSNGRGAAFQSLAQQACPVRRLARWRVCVRVEVGADGPTEVDPAGTVLSFLAPERPFDADVVRSFCHFVHFFQLAREWTARHAGTFTLSLKQGFELGRRTNQAAFGSALRKANVAA